MDSDNTNLSAFIQLLQPQNENSEMQWTVFLIMDIEVSGEKKKINKLEINRNCGVVNYYSLLMQVFFLSWETQV